MRELERFSAPTGALEAPFITGSHAAPARSFKGIVQTCAPAAHVSPALHGSGVHWWSAEQSDRPGQSVFFTHGTRESTHGVGGVVLGMVARCAENSEFIRHTACAVLYAASASAASSPRHHTSVGAPAPRSHPGPVQPSVHAHVPCLRTSVGVAQSSPVHPAAHGAQTPATQSHPGVDAVHSAPPGLLCVVSVHSGPQNPGAHVHWGSSAAVHANWAEVVGVAPEATTPCATNMELAAWEHAPAEHVAFWPHVPKIQSSYEPTAHPLRHTLVTPHTGCAAGHS